MFNLAIAAIVETVLMQISAEQVQSLCMVVRTPSYLKLVTSSNFWPFMIIVCTAVVCAVVMIILFSVLPSIQHAPALSLGLVVRPPQNYPSGFLGGWAMLLSTEEMLDGQHERVDSPPNVRTAHNGLLQKRLEEDLS